LLPLGEPDAGQIWSMDVIGFDYALEVGDEEFG